MYEEGKDMNRRDKYLKKLEKFDQKLKRIKDKIEVKKYLQRFDRVNEAIGKLYTRKEETYNIISHGIGIGFAGIALIVMIVFGVLRRSPGDVISYVIYGLSMLTMFLASTLYHAADDPDAKSKMRVFDHASIYLMIAGSYTVVCVAGLWGTLRVVVLTVVWIMALIGIVIKIVGKAKGTFGHKDKLSTILYIAMGWMSVLIIRLLIRNIGVGLVIYLLVGGILYTIGAFIYRNKNIKYNHAIWHLFVLMATAVQFAGILIYIVL